MNIAYRSVRHPNRTALPEVALRLLARVSVLGVLVTGCAVERDPNSDPPSMPGSGGKTGATTARAVPGIILGNSILQLEPLLATTWGQADAYQARTPRKNGARTYPGCTTIAAAQVLYYYQYQDHANREVYYDLDHAPLTGPDVVDNGTALRIDLPAHRYDYGAMATSLDHASAAQIDATASFIYHVGASLSAQFGGGEGSSATGKQLENAFRYQWGYNNISRRKMSVIGKEAFGYDDTEWLEVVKDELTAGRPVLYMAQQVDADAGHAFVIDGYNRDGLVHVNWGWGGRGNGYYDLNILADPHQRRWTRNAMIFRGLEPEKGYAAKMRRRETPPMDNHAWHGNASLISYRSGIATGYGLTEDEARLHRGGSALPVVFLQWEVDQRDGARLEIDAAGMSNATVTYGPWGDRRRDRRYQRVSLPFVLDPTADGFDVGDGEYFTIAVASDAPLAAPVTVSARPTSAPATAAASEPGRPINLGSNTWNGNGSLISYSSGTDTGYGLTIDETRIHPESADDPVVFFQWELDRRDGLALEIAADGMSDAIITYGSWDDRSTDITKAVELPFVLDPAADGKSTADGTYYVVEVAFVRKPAATTSVTASIVSP